jgi:DNA polymerase I-like protein with 3'-5' exonuclease and polymerase domains
LIKPPPGYGLAYIDWSVQEFAIAAVLSGDEAMIADYRSGDPYLAFGKQIGRLHADATKETHAGARQLFKQCVLGIGFGMEEFTLAQRTGLLPIQARDILRAHREAYPRFWQWSDAAVDHATLHGSLHTVFGWHIHVGADSNPRSLRNFPMQANGAEMMRLAACFATERGIEVCAPVHDAFLICAPLERLETDVAAMRSCMAEASRAVLEGFEVRTDVKIIRYPEHYTDPRGAVMWERVMKLIARRRQSAAEREVA